MKHGLTPLQRIAIYTERKGTDECWSWKAGTDQNGYPQIRDGRRTRRVSRLLTKAPEGVLVMHTCNRPNCVNPAHLRLGDYSANNTDAIRDRLRSGMTAPKLSFSQAELMRSSQEPRKVLAAQFGVSLSVVHDVLANRTYLRDHTSKGATV